MALDYSKLSDDELDAIANDDYSRLSDATLRALANDPSAQQSPVPLGPQAVNVVGGAIKELAPAITKPIADVAGTAFNMAKGSVQDLGSMAKIATQITPEAVVDYLQHPIRNTFGNYVNPATGQATQTPGLIKSYIQGHPWASKLGQSSIASLSGDALEYARGLGGRLPTMGQIGSGMVQGAIAPENLLAVPYQMAAYEQEKIRANPTAPEYQTNPYAQAYRGEFPTQGAAGAANRRNAIASQQYGGLTPEEQDILEQDRIDRDIRKKAAQRVLGPVAPR